MKRLNFAPRSFFSAVILLFSFNLGVVGFAHGQIWKKLIPFSETSKETASVIKLPITEEQLQLFVNEDMKSLSSQKMDSRLMGTKGAEAAGMYIGKTLNSFGVSPFARNFVHTFWFVSGKDFTPETRFTVGRNYIFIPEEAFPAPYSASGELRNYVLPDTRELGQPWIVPLYENAAEANNPKFDWISESYKRAQMAVKRGASAVIFYDAIGGKYAPVYERNSKFEAMDIPVVIVKNKAYAERFKNLNTLTPLYLNIKFKKDYSKAANIIGYIDNNANEDVLILAHYDGAAAADQSPFSAEEFNNSSGVAAMISLARLLVKGEAKKYNYIFAALSDGVSAQLGAAALIEDKSFDKSKLAYVLNFVNVGLGNPTQQLYVNGITSSQAWVPFFADPVKGMEFKFEDDGVAAADNVPFLKEKIPALSFTSNIPGEVFPNNDAPGFPVRSSGNIVDVVTLAYRLIVTMNGQGRPLFAGANQKEEILDRLTHLNQPPVVSEPKSQLNQARSAITTPVVSRASYAPTRKIEVGIVCDSSYQGFGVKIYDILKQKPAERAGLKPGDIILQMGTRKITTAADYAEVLNKLRPGAKMVVKVKRGVTVQNFTITAL